MPPQPTIQLVANRLIISVLRKFLGSKSAEEYKDVAEYQVVAGQWSLCWLFRQRGKGGAASQYEARRLTGHGTTAAHYQVRRLAGRSAGSVKGPAERPLSFWGGNFMRHVYLYGA